MTAIANRYCIANSISKWRGGKPLGSKGTRQRWDLSSVAGNECSHRPADFCLALDGDDSDVTVSKRAGPVPDPEENRPIHRCTGGGDSSGTPRISKWESSPPIAGSPRTDARL